MKKAISFAMTVLLAVGCIASVTGCSSKSAGAKGDVIYVGVYEPASGDNGAGGKQEVLGIEYANSLNNTVELDGKSYTIELVEVDNQTSTDKAVSAASVLVSKGVSVVIGSFG